MPHGYDDATGKWDTLGRDELISELARANRRLSGTLRIILSTLDSTDVPTLFARVFEELSETLEATGAIMYLTERDGFHLRGTSSGVDVEATPAYVPFGRTLEAITTRAGHAMRLRVLPPSDDELRRGRLTQRRVLDEDTRAVHEVDAATLPPFTSLMAVPVWFGQQVIALVEVGWTLVRPTRREDAELLEAVAQYLSVQLVGAFSAMRQQRETELREVATQLQTALLQQAEVDVASVDTTFGRVAGELGATYAPVSVNGDRGAVVARLPLDGQTDVPSEVLTLGEDRVTMRALMPGDELHDWLDAHGEPCVGAFVGIGRVAGARRGALLLRPQGLEPLDDAEMTFVRHVAEGIRRAAAGEEARTQDKRISQALQTGMRNELQHVDGITAEGVYSSATAAAFVGGDFYDLVALPMRRACVIMGDVSGKGVEAASVSAAVKTALSAYAWEGVAPARMVALLNDFLLGFSKLETFATLFVGIIDLTAATLTYCSAGHPPAIVRRAATGDLEPLDVQSGAVGAFHEMEYRDGKVDLADGDLLLLYTDGTTEARDGEGRFFGEDALRDAIVREAPAGVSGLPARLLTLLDDFTGRNLEDDVAIVAVRIDHVGDVQAV